MGTSPSNSSCDTLVPPTSDHGKGFSPPPKSYIDFFEVKIADGGHTYVKISPYIDEEESNSERTRVGVDISCQSFSRQISSISTHITPRHAKVTGVEPCREIKSGVQQIKFETKRRERSSIGLQSIGVSPPIGFGFKIKGGWLKMSEEGETHKGMKTSYETLSGFSRHGDTASFMLKGISPTCGGDGLSGEHGDMRFYLENNPHEELKFDYDCRIEHVKGKKQKTKKCRSRNWFQRHIMSLFCL
ncbi:hypothetical protein VKT23_010504 [Stygiomarasmius scandens]|uniref:Uncharacterized protein n=1 Tax=Marasmiellus scandens TaxID=2682957 RepID=A0ABR1JHM4_9AGAR